MNRPGIGSVPRSLFKTVQLGLEPSFMVSNIFWRLLLAFWVRHWLLLVIFALVTLPMDMSSNQKSSVQCFSQLALALFFRSEIHGLNPSLHWTGTNLKLKYPGLVRGTKPVPWARPLVLRTVLTVRTSLCYKVSDRPTNGPWISYPDCYWFSITNFGRGFIYIRYTSNSTSDKFKLRMSSSCWRRVWRRYLAIKDANSSGWSYYCICCPSYGLLNA